MLDLPLLRTKIAVPQIPHGFVHRPRLTEKVAQGAHGPLTLIAAPAGFGKTNLLIEWTKAADLPVAWLTLDSQDNDVNRFFYYLIGALQTVVPGLGEEALEFVQLTAGTNLEAGLTLLINDLSALPKEIALVLDDFQVLENPAVLQGVGFLLRYLPPNLHLVIASRSEPRLDLTSQRAKGRVVEVGTDELRFTGEEVVQYFQQAVGLQLPPETVAALEERTYGWITSLQMAAIALRNRADPAALLANLQGKAYYITAFLTEEVLNRQPVELRQFLLRSSILETLTGPLCEAVVEPDAQPGYGKTVLSRLEEAHLFITALDEEHEWFRYHPLFADVLRQAQTEANPAEIPELHKRAALWLEQNGYLAEAFRHALESCDIAWAADMIERNRQTVLDTGGVSTFIYWVGRLPEEVTRGRPHLILAYAWALMATHQLDLAQDWLDDLARTLDQLDSLSDAAPVQDRQETWAGFGEADLQYFRSSLVVCRSTLAMFSGDMEQAAEYSQQASGDLSEENIYLRSLLAVKDSIYVIASGDTQKAIESLHATMRIARQANNLLALIIAVGALADMQMLQGQLSKAWESLQKAQFLPKGPGGGPHPLSGLVNMGLGGILLERDYLEEASDYLERGCQATQSMWYMAGLNGSVTLARLRQAQGDISGAHAVIAEAAGMALRTDSSEWDDAFVCAAAVRLALQRDDLATAEQWWQKGGFPDPITPIAPESYPYHIWEYLLLTQISFLLLRGQETGGAPDLVQAAALLGSLLPQAERFRRVTSQIQILVLQARVQAALGDEGATEILSRALALGEPEGYRRIYLDEGWRLAELLRQCRSARQDSGSGLPSLAFLDGLLESLQRSATGQPFERHPLEPRATPATARPEEGLPIYLSAREVEVLTLIAAGKSNQEIGSELYLALNTVKRHAYNIYAKLEVSKRTQAVSRARQLGLIE